MMLTGSQFIDAQRAYDRVARERKLSTLFARLRRRCLDCARLAVFDERSLRPTVGRGIREIPLESIIATVEPSRAEQFDRWFRPAGRVPRARWQRVWLAEQTGAALPPISVVKVGELYAVRDGHHRVSVARARGALTIDAVVEAG